MEIKEILDWAFERHLNPISWYIRPIFLIAFCFFSYKRSWKGVIITILIMMSSMVWFPAPEKIDSQMQAVLEYEKQILSNPFSAIIAISTMIITMTLIGFAFWKRSLLFGIIVLNLALVGKLISSITLVGKEGWGPLYVIIFGLLLVNGIGILLYYFKKKKKQSNN